MKAAQRPGSVIRVAGQNYLDKRGIAELIGVEASTVHIYHKRAMRNRREGTVKAWDLPEPDATFGNSPVWLVKTIEAWIPTRPRPGAHGRTPGNTTSD